MYEKSNVEIVRNGINLDSLVSKKNFKKQYKIDSNFILFVGRFSRSKGIDVLIDAIKIIKDDLTRLNTRLVIMGVDFGYEDEMMETIEKYFF